MSHGRQSEVQGQICHERTCVYEEGCWRPWHRKVLSVSVGPLVNAEDDHVGRPGTFLSLSTV